ncbi:unnamed protein product [Prorocentrum cordatum]|uniref:KIF-binding protein n=1 Tax=Prorocentrum cordatum TaxID=2364126 RepID=A0ABN9VWN8_9DINO|nr:unnamed protein product [Polarella glacialis]
MEASYKEKCVGSALSDNCSHEEASECQADAEGFGGQHGAWEDGPPGRLPIPGWACSAWEDGARGRLSTPGGAGAAWEDGAPGRLPTSAEAARTGDSKPRALEPRACGAEALVEAPEGTSKGVRWADDLDEITQQVVPEVSAAAEAPTEAQQLILGAAMLAREALQRGGIAEGLRLLEAAQAKCLEN